MWKKILLAILLIMSATAGFFVAKAQVTMNNTLNHVTRDYKTALSKVDLNGIKVNSDDAIINILLLGNDKRKEKFYNANGLTDTMIIATMDLKHKTLKLTTLMRDMDVEIPGHGMTKLNAANSYGGVQLLYKTIAQNFNIQLDGYVEVGFTAFEKLVNDIGGIDVELTKEEAYYLNNTNYIRNKKYRNVKTGKNHVNGSQALGYCRIRKGYRDPVTGQRVVVRTVTGKTDDYGRTWRQRTVLTAIYNKVKTIPMTKWVNIANDLLSEVKTDLDNDTIINYMKDVVMIGTTQVHQLQIPIDGSFTGDNSKLYINKEVNANALNDFVFNYDGKGGEYQYKGTISSPSAASSVTPISTNAPTTSTQ